jgi:hypothetical protein
VSISSELDDVVRKAVRVTFLTKIILEKAMFHVFHWQCFSQELAIYPNPFIPMPQI